MLDRRRFIHRSLLSSASVLFFKKSLADVTGKKPKKGPLIVSTWAHNVKANAEAWRVLSANGRALDAVEAGVQIPEADPADQSVGYGGLPDRDGKVTLDACIMDEWGNCGAVMALEGIMHPIKVARLVMDKTPHVQLAGEGARQFALQNGFKLENLLTPEAEKAWKDWMKSQHYDPMTIPKLLEKQNTPGQVNNHDTIGMLALDAAGNLSGACTTSGMAFKMRGRVGDSPIIGAGLYVDNEVGAATSSGVGEEVVRICGSHTVVELMRHGATPEAACKQACERLIKKRGVAKAKEIQVGFIAVDKTGNVGAYSILESFTYAVHSPAGSKVYTAKHIL